MNDQSHHNRKHEQVSNTDSSKRTSEFLTFNKLYALEQKKAKHSPRTNKKANFGPIADANTSEPSFPNHLTLHELFERNSWKKSTESTPPQEKHFFSSDKNGRNCNGFLTLYKSYQMQGLECNNQRTILTKREFIPNPAHKEFFTQFRNEVMERAPEWMKSVWRKQASQQTSEGSKIAEVSEKETMEDEQTDSENHDSQQSNLVHRSFNTSTNHSQVYFQGDRRDSNVRKNLELSKRHENYLERERFSKSFNVPLSQMRDELLKKKTLQREEHKVEDGSSKKLAGQNTETASVWKEKSFCEKVNHKQIINEWTEWSVKLFGDEFYITGKCNGVTSTSEDVSHWKRIDAYTLKNCKKNIVHRLVGLPDHYIGTGFPSFIQRKFQNGFPKDWIAVLKLWSKMQHEGDTVKYTKQQLENNSSDESDAFASSMDTVKYTKQQLENNSSDESDAFASSMDTVKYTKQPLENNLSDESDAFASSMDTVKYTKQPLENNLSDESDAFAPSMHQPSTSLSASESERQKMFNARVVVRKLELSQLEHSSFKVREERSRAVRNVQQTELSKKRDGIRKGTSPLKVQASQQIKYTATLRRVPDVPSSFDETDTSFVEW